MAQLTIKNIGPLKEISIELNKINVFIGPQSSGKSTISKILCHCQWVEKTCYLDDEELKHYEKKEVFYKSLVEYHRLEGYFNKTASIKYIGEYLTITYTHSSEKIIIKKIKKPEYSYPKISYIPSERNLVAAISNFDKYNEGSDVILHFGYDWTDARDTISQMDLSKVLERNISYEYKNSVNYIKDGEAEILLKFASSGVLSLLPLYLTISYMCDMVYKKERSISSRKRKKINHFSDIILKYRNELGHGINLNPEDFIPHTDILLESLSSSVFVNEITEIRKMHKNLDYNSFADALHQLSIKIEEIFNYRYSQLFIEEPEQNLFPEAQKKLMYEIISQINSDGQDHRLCITTHSPYVLYALNNCMMGGLVGKKMPQEEKEELNSYKHKAWIHPDNVNLWQIKDGKLLSMKNEKTGTVGQHYFNEVMSSVMEEYYEMLTYLDNEK